MQRTHRAARCGFGRRVDQIDDGLGLRQIELAVEIGAARKFAGFGEPGAKIEATCQQHVQHDRAAMALQFKDVFAGVGVGSRKIEQQAGVDQTTVGRPEISQRRQTR